MKRLITLAVVAVVLFSVAIALKWRNSLKVQEKRTFSSREGENEEYREEEEEKEEQGIKKSLQYLSLLYANQNTGKVELTDVHNARQQMQQLRANANTGRRALPLDLTWESQGPDNVGGRTRAFMIDKNNPNHIITGGVSGGLFYSDDEGLSWHPHAANESMGHLGIATIRQAPNGDIYVGTGETFAVSSGIPVSFGCPGFIGEGIYKSTDGGQTFNHLPSTTLTTSNSDQDTWSFVNEIAIDPNNSDKIYAATNGGLKISTDGGNTWIAPTGIAPPTNASSYEVAVTANGTVLAEINFKYYRSTDGITFTNKMGSGGFPSGNIGRMEFAVSPEDGNYVYTVIANSGWSGSLNGILKSTDGGLSWTPIISSNSQTFNVLGEQGTWNIALGIDPKNKDKIFVGGQLELWSYENGGWNQVAAWFNESPTNPYYVHADMHGVFFNPVDNNIMFVISDGGIYKTYNSTQQFPTFTMRNKGYTVTQFYDIAASDDGLTMGGAQDNGTQLIDFEGNTRRASIEVYGGDGGACEFSGINKQALFASTYQARVYRSSNGGESFGRFYDNNCDRDNNGEIDQGALFLLPTFLWEQDNSDTLVNGNDTTIIEDLRSVYFVGASTKVWFTPDALNFSSQPYWYELEASGTVSEVEVSPDGTVYYGTTSGNAYKVTGLTGKYVPIDTIDISGATGSKKIIKYGTDFPKPSRNNWDFPTNTNTYGGLTRTSIGVSQTWGGARYVTGIGVDPNNTNNIVVTLANYGNQNYVYLSTNGGANYTSIQNNLPKMPVFDAIIDADNPNNIILGTELGVWGSTDLGQNWTEENAGMVSVPTFKLLQRKLYNADCKVIYAGTHGRGIFRTTTLTKSGCNLVAGIKNPKPAPVSMMEVYPNPVYDKAFVEFELKNSNEPVNLLVVDVMGRTYRNEKLTNLHAGANKIEVSFDNIAAGVYLLTLQTGKSSESKRVFVTK